MNNPRWTFGHDQWKETSGLLKLISYSVVQSKFKWT